MRETQEMLGIISLIIAIHNIVSVPGNHIQVVKQQQGSTACLQISSCVFGCYMLIYIFIYINTISYNHWPHCGGKFVKLMSFEIVCTT